MAYSDAIPKGFEKRWGKMSPRDKAEARRLDDQQKRDKVKAKGREKQSVKDAMKKRKKVKPKSKRTGTSPATSTRKDYKDLLK